MEFNPVGVEDDAHGVLASHHDVLDEGPHFQVEVSRNCQHICPQQLMLALIKAVHVFFKRNLLTDIFHFDLDLHFNPTFVLVYDVLHLRKAPCNCCYYCLPPFVCTTEGPEPLKGSIVVHSCYHFRFLISPELWTVFDASKH